MSIEITESYTDKEIAELSGLPADSGIVARRLLITAKNLELRVRGKAFKTQAFDSMAGRKPATPDSIRAQIAAESSDLAGMIAATLELIKKNDAQARASMFLTQLLLFIGLVLLSAILVFK